MAATDARAIPFKNQAYRVTFPIFDADGDPVSGAAALDSEVSKDAGAFADCTNEATEIGTSGIYYLDLTSTEMNADTVAVRVQTSTSGAKTAVIILYPQETADLVVTVGANNDKTGYTASTVTDKTGYTVSTVTDKTGYTVSTVSDKTGYALSATGLDSVVTAEPAGVPAFGGTLKAAISWLLALARNKVTQTATTQTLRNDADSASIATAAVSDDGTTYTRAKFL